MLIGPNGCELGFLMTVVAVAVLPMLTLPKLCVSGVAVIGLTVGYLKQVTHQRYPSGRRAKEMEL